MAQCSLTLVGYMVVAFLNKPAEAFQEWWGEHLEQRINIKITETTALFKFSSLTKDLTQLANALHKLYFCYFKMTADSVYRDFFPHCKFVPPISAFAVCPLIFQLVFLLQNKFKKEWSYVAASHHFCSRRASVNTAANLSTNLSQCQHPLLA